MTEHNITVTQPLEIKSGLGQLKPPVATPPIAPKEVPPTHLVIQIPQVKSRLVNKRVFTIINKDDSKEYIEIPINQSAVAVETTIKEVYIVDYAHDQVVTNTKLI